MSSAPSDWENGVLAAHKYLYEHGHDSLADRMVKELGKDPEGTEVRVVRQIAQWLMDRGLLMTNNKRASVLLKLLAKSVLQYDWRLK